MLQHSARKALLKPLEMIGAEGPALKRKFRGVWQLLVGFVGRHLATNFHARASICPFPCMVGRLPDSAGNCSAAHSASDAGSGTDDKCTFGLEPVANYRVEAEICRGAEAVTGQTNLTGMRQPFGP